MEGSADVITVEHDRISSRDYNWKCSYTRFTDWLELCLSVLLAWYYQRHNTAVAGQRLDFSDLPTDSWGHDTKVERLLYSSVRNGGEVMWNVDEGRGSRRAAYGFKFNGMFLQRIYKTFWNVPSSKIELHKSRRLLHEVNLSNSKKRRSAGHGSRLEWQGILPNYVPGLESLWSGVWFMEVRECWMKFSP